ncbi:unnamed protein product [Caenorhabditis brenneri]
MNTNPQNQTIRINTFLIFRPGSRIDKLPSEKTLKNFPIHNPFTILDVNGFDGATAEKKKKPTRQKKFHPVLSLNCLFSENRILGSPIVPLGILNVRYNKAKANRKLGERAADHQVDWGSDIGGCSKNQQGVATECGEERRVTTGKNSGMDRELGSLIFTKLFWATT